MKISCPGFHEFWAERDRVNGIHELPDLDGFRRSDRLITRAERRAHPGAIILVKDGMETLVPNVDYVALRDIEYRTFVRAVLEANFPRQITLQEMQLIWDTLVYKILRFECACVKEGKAGEVSLSRTLNRFLSLINIYQSMGVDGYNQEQYLQLALDVRCGNPAPRPSLIVKLPLPPHRYLRKRKLNSSDSETDDAETGADEVLKSHPLSRVTRFRQNYTERSQQDNSPTAYIQKRRSKRRHRSGPGEDYGVPGKSHLSSLIHKHGLADTAPNNQLGYPFLLPADRSAPVPLGQLPSLPNIFTRPAGPPAQTLGPEHEWLDPQLLGQSSMEPTANAQSDRLAGSTGPGLTDTRDVTGDSRHEEDAEEEIGAWSM